MTMRRLPVSVALVLVSAVVASPGFASDTSSHSGAIVSIDLASHKLQLEEMGP